MQLDDNNNTWRNHWFVENVLAEIPIINGFFKSNNVKVALQHSGKSAFMLAGGTTLMLLNIMGVNETDSPVEEFGKMTANMAVGMFGGHVLFNTLFFISNKMVKCYNTDSSEKEQGEAAQKLIEPEGYAHNG